MNWRTLVLISGVCFLLNHRFMKHLTILCLQDAKHLMYQTSLFSLH